jgi:hypothetical protein
VSALDGNAVAGLLRDVFGVEMTVAIGECAHCGRRAPLGETASYLRGPGVVLRCRTCESIVVVVTEVHGINCVDVSGLRDLEAPRG